ncbi:MAG TPA: META domain-containing protein [Microvirga sp.]|nr:META domain-containing protein [Microvirga sp.]
MTALRTAALVAVSAMLAAALGSAAQAQSSPRSQQAARGQPVQAPQPRQLDKVFPVGASWIAVSLNGRRFTGDRPSLTVNQQFRATGFAGCNNFSATAFPLREQGLAVSPFALTKRSCGRDVMASEQAFLIALRTAAKWEQQGSTLILRSPNGELRFERAL